MISVYKTYIYTVRARLFALLHSSEGVQPYEARYLAKGNPTDVTTVQGTLLYDQLDTTSTDSLKHETLPLLTTK